MRKCVVMIMAEKTKRRTRMAPREFVQTNERFVLERSKVDRSVEEQRESLLQLLLAMPVEERIQFFFDNFESIFTSMFPDDVGYFAWVPSSEEEWEDLEVDLSKGNSS